MARKMYVCSHNTLHDYASKIKFENMAAARVYYEDAIKLNMKHMFYTIVDSSDRVIRDSRKEALTKEYKSKAVEFTDKRYSLRLEPAFRQSYHRFAIAAGLSKTYSFAFEHIAEYYYRIFICEIR